MYFVYMHESPNSKQYIGQSSHPISRWCGGYGYINNDDFYSDIKKYGWDNIKHYLLKSCESRTEAIKYETLFIVLLQSEYKGYNNTDFLNELISCLENKQEIVELENFDGNEDSLTEETNIFKKHHISITSANMLINDWIYSERDRKILKNLEYRWLK